MRKFNSSSGERFGRKPVVGDRKRGRKSSKTLTENVKLLISPALKRDLEKEARRIDIPFAEYTRRLLNREILRLTALRSKKTENTKKGKVA
tara:strand:- start:1532 stop:1804 length:273 start_codon:yes stop_codon:yes gene_type:complete